MTGFILTGAGVPGRSCSEIASVTAGAAASAAMNSLRFMPSTQSENLWTQRSFPRQKPSDRLELQTRHKERTPRCNPLNLVTERHAAGAGDQS